MRYYKIIALVLIVVNLTLFCSCSDSLPENKTTQTVVSEEPYIDGFSVVNGIPK